MRLIDADKLMESLNPKESVWVGLVLSELIANAETEKAIPIEWMKKFANERALNDGMDCYWHFWGEDLLQMIEQWEKENE